MSSVEYSGGCLCGRTRYRIRGATRNHCYCHCRSCRLAAGAPLVAWFSVDQDQFELLQGELRMLRATPKAERGFCAHCGTALSYAHDDRAADLDITLASLDLPHDLRPRCHIWLEDKLPWVDLGDGLPGHARWAK